MTRHRGNGLLKWVPSLVTASEKTPSPVQGRGVSVPYKHSTGGFFISALRLVISYTLSRHLQLEPFYISSRQSVLLAISELRMVDGDQTDDSKFDGAKKAP